MHLNAGKQLFRTSAIFVKQTISFHSHRLLCPTKIKEDHSRWHCQADGTLLNQQEESEESEPRATVIDRGNM